MCANDEPAGPFGPTDLHRKARQQNVAGEGRMGLSRGGRGASETRQSTRPESRPEYIMALHAGAGGNTFVEMQSRQ